MHFVPVVDQNQKSLMPTIPSRARRFIKSGKATPFFKKGIFCIKLNKKPSNNKTQEIAVGIDPGSKREGFTVKSESHTYLNIQTKAIDWVKDAIEVRRNMRRGRRFRKTPCRKNRFNRKRGSLPPSTKARWQWKLNIIKLLTNIFPITHVIVEDISAKTKKNCKKWNSNFSPIEVGKQWFYTEIEKLVELETRSGYETYEERTKLGLKKTGKKTEEKFSAHCVDSWVLANMVAGGHIKPDNEDLLILNPIRLHRRQLHRLQPKKGGRRSNYGSTRSLGFKRGSLVKHIKYGLCYIGGCSKGRVSLHDVQSGTRLCQNGKVTGIKFLSYSTLTRKEYVYFLV